MSGNDPQLEGKRFLVSGGGGGLGGEICRMLGEAGASVIVADLDLSRATECAASLEQTGVKAHAVGVDVSDAQAVDRLFKEIGRAGGHLAGRIDGIINNAAIDITLPVEEVDTEQWRRVLMVNLYGPYLLVHAAVPLMKAQGSGHIVNIASTASKRAWPNASAYHATKWGVLGFSHALHAELRPHRIKVSAIVAGGMRTPFLLDRFPDIDTSTLQDPANVARAVRFVLTQPEETVIPEVMVLPMKETSWP
ncbi:SDR family oxidoreductase [Cupriavidus pinatubonensis]|uniref:SDR family oxidoreductase n=1 Tax=Cupriavidus pinatubonensis TaxID=248026 RepID=UPI001C73D4DE|nr:SDR family oxidoreductase [Cupriavidus pinatubonensis]QYY28555.1 SDR family oxidoreductase [Cupriavidus pinatubonensis]